MPTYLAPGVYVEETSFQVKAIVGVDTSTAAFIGPTRFGPILHPPPLITSLTEFERIYGDSRHLDFGAGPASTPYIWYSVRAFFEEGGRRLYVSRIFKPLAGGHYRPPAATLARDINTDMAWGHYSDGHARCFIRHSATETRQALALRACFPGSAGNLQTSLSFRYGPNILTGTAAAPGITTLANHDMVLIDAIRGGNGILSKACYNSRATSWSFATGSGKIIPLKAMDPAVQRIRILSVDFALATAPVPQNTWTALPLDPRHTSTGIKDSLLARFGRRRIGDSSNLDLPIEILAGKGINSGLALIQLLTRLNPELESGLLTPDAPHAVLHFDCQLAGGNDGLPPEASHYAGRTTPGRSGLKAVEDIPDIATAAAPGAPQSAILPLIRHCESMRYRFAIIDSQEQQDANQVRALAAGLRSGHAALYYPWLLARDVRTGQAIPLPPSGFVAGIYARNDVERGVWKAPANEPVRSALGVEITLTQAQQEILNPEGINCLREFPGRGLRVWGARTLSADPEWKYVNVRRYCCYLERSIDEGTQWAVFEPNDEPLWSRVRGSVEGFLYNEWRSGALLGSKPEQAFFVRCDRGTMTQDDLDNGHLICLVGVAPTRPAEFILFRIGQWTANARH